LVLGSLERKEGEGRGMMLHCGHRIVGIVVLGVVLVAVLDRAIVRGRWKCLFVGSNGRRIAFYNLFDAVSLLQWLVWLA